MDSLLFGVVPALILARTELHAALKTGVRGASSGSGGALARRVLVAAEVCLAVMLPVAAGLLMRTVQRLTREDPGFASEGVLTASLELPQRQYQDWTSVVRFYSEVARTLREEAGVRVSCLRRWGWLPARPEDTFSGVSCPGSCTA